MSSFPTASLTFEAQYFEQVQGVAKRRCAELDISESAEPGRRACHFFRDGTCSMRETKHDENSLSHHPSLYVDSPNAIGWKTHTICQSWALAYLPQQHKIFKCVLHSLQGPAAVIYEAMRQEERKLVNMAELARCREANAEYRRQQERRAREANERNRRTREALLGIIDECRDWQSRIANIHNASCVHEGWSIFLKAAGCERDSTPDLAHLREWIESMNISESFHSEQLKTALDLLRNAAQYAQQRATAKNEHKQTTRRNKLERLGGELKDYYPVLNELKAKICELPSLTAPPAPASISTSLRASAATAPLAVQNLSPASRSTPWPALVPAEASLQAPAAAVGSAVDRVSTPPLMLVASEGPLFHEELNSAASTTTTNIAHPTHRACATVTTVSLPAGGALQNATPEVPTVQDTEVMAAIQEYIQQLTAEDCADCWPSHYVRCSHTDKPVVSSCKIEDRLLCVDCSKLHPSAVRSRKHQLQLLCLLRQCLTTEAVISGLTIDTDRFPIVCRDCFQAYSSDIAHVIKSANTLFQSLNMNSSVSVSRPAGGAAAGATAVSAAEAPAAASVHLLSHPPALPPAYVATFLGQDNTSSSMMENTSPSMITSRIRSSTPVKHTSVQMLNLLRYVVTPLLADMFGCSYDAASRLCKACNRVHSYESLTVECICSLLDVGAEYYHLRAQVRRASPRECGHRLLSQRFDASNIQRLYKLALNQDMRDLPGVNALISARNNIVHILQMTEGEANETRGSILAGVNNAKRYLQRTHRQPSFNVDEVLQQCLRKKLPLELEQDFLQYVEYEVRLRGQLSVDPGYSPVLQATQRACELLLSDKEFDSCTLLLLPCELSALHLRDQIDFLRTSVRWRAVIDLSQAATDEALDVPRMWSEEQCRNAMSGPWLNESSAGAADTMYTHRPLKALSRIGSDPDNTSHLVVIVGCAIANETHSGWIEVNWAAMQLETLQSSINVGVTLLLDSSSAQLLHSRSAQHRAVDRIQELLEVAGRSRAKNPVNVVSFSLLGGLIATERQQDQLWLLPGAEPIRLRPMVAADRWKAIIGEGIELLTVGCEVIEGDEETRNEKLRAHLQSFVLGGSANWALFHYDKVVSREQLADIVDVLHNSRFGGTSIILAHGFGDGATTLARHAAYTLRHDYVVVYLSRTMNESRMGEFRSLLGEVEQHTGLKVLVVLDCDYNAAEAERMWRHLNDFLTLYCVHHSGSGAAKEKEGTRYVHRDLRPLSPEEQKKMQAFFPHIFPARKLSWEGCSLQQFMTGNFLNVTKLLCYAETETDVLAGALISLCRAAHSSNKVQDLLNKQFWPLEIFELAGGESFASELVETGIPLLQFGLLNFDTAFADRAKKLVHGMIRSLEGNSSLLGHLKLIVFFSLYAPGTGVPYSLVADPGGKLHPMLDSLCYPFYRRGKLVEIRVPKLAYMLAEDGQMFGPLSGPNDAPEKLVRYVSETLLPYASVNRIQMLHALHQAFCIFDVWHWPAAHARSDREEVQHNNRAFIVESIRRFTTDQYCKAQEIAVKLSAIFLLSVVPETSAAVVTQMCSWLVELTRNKYVSLTRSSDLLDTAEKLLADLVRSDEKLDTATHVLHNRGLIHRARALAGLQKREVTKSRATPANSAGSTSSIDARAATTLLSGEDLVALASRISDANSFFEDALSTSGYSFAHPAVAQVQMYLNVIKTLKKLLGVQSKGLVDSLSKLNLPDSHGAQELANLLRPDLMVPLLLLRLRQARVAVKYVRTDSVLTRSSEQKTQDMINICMAQLKPEWSENLAPTVENARRWLLSGELEPKMLAWCLAVLGKAVKDPSRHDYVLPEDLVEAATSLAAAGAEIARGAWRDLPAELRDLAEKTMRRDGDYFFQLQGLVEAACEKLQMKELHGLTPLVANLLLHLVEALTRSGEEQQEALKRANHKLAEWTRSTRYFNTRATRYFVALQSVLENQPLTSFISVARSPTLADIKGADREADYARTFASAGVAMFQGRITKLDPYPAVQVDELNMEVRFSAPIRRLGSGVDTGSGADAACGSDLVLGAEVTFGLGIKDVGLWAHGLCVRSVPRTDRTNSSEWEEDI